MRHLDLFSGIGGFALAAERVWGADHEIVAFCEIDKFCQKVLKKHWPTVQIVNEIKDLRGYGKTADIITGGFPCQPYSIAGQQGGAVDDRHLWPEMERVIRELQPSWVIAENVIGFVEMALDGCISDLENQGYHVTTFIIPACAVNARHRRDRVWIMANLDGDGLEQAGRRLSETRGDGIKRSTGGRPERNAVTFMADTRGLPLWDALTDAEGERSQGLGTEGLEESKAHGKAAIPMRDGGDGDLGDTESDMVRIFHGIPATLDRGVKIKNKGHRIKALGNAIVPQVAQVIFQAIKDVETI